MKRIHLFIALLAAGFLSQSALAGGWHKVGSFTAGGDAKEMGVDRNCSACLIKVTEGSVIINTVVVREKSSKDPIKVGERIEKGGSKEIDVGDKLYVKGCRISDDGRGKYDVYVK